MTRHLHYWARIWRLGSEHILGVCVMTCDTWHLAISFDLAVVVAGGVPLWRASWPRLVRRASSRPVALCALVSFPVAVVPSATSGAVAPGFTGRLQVEASREPGSLCLPLAPAEAGALGSLRVVPVRGPAMVLSLAGRSGFGLELRALPWVGVCGPRH